MRTFTWPANALALGPFLAFSACAVVEDITPPWQETGVPEETDLPIDTDLPPQTDLFLIINEVMPGNASTIAGPGAQFADWIEVVNTGATSAAWSRITLQAEDGTAWQGSEGELLPGDRALVWLGENTGILLDKDGDGITLLGDGVPLDHVVWSKLGSDVSFARTPDRSEFFAPTALPTPDSENHPTPSATLDPANETLFTTSMVHQIRFQFTPQALRQIDEPQRPEVHVAMDIDGVRYPDIGLALKGSASYQTMDRKPAFIADLNEWVLGTEFRGIKGWRLHNGYIYDPTRVHERLTYQLAQDAGLLAPRVGWAEVWCNNEYYGIYTLVERHDAELIAQQYPDQKDIGVMLEPNEGFGDFGWGSINEGSVLPAWENGTLPADPRIIETLQAVDRIVGRSPTDQNLQELWNYVEQDKLLDYLAWEQMVAHTDGYMAPNNWRAFVNAVTYKVELVPSGAEWTWDNYVGAFGGGGGLRGFCNANNNCKRELGRHVLQMADRVENLDLVTQFFDLSTWLDPYTDIDPRYNSFMGGGNVVDGEREITMNSMRTWPDNIRSAVRAEFPGLMP